MKKIFIGVLLIGFFSACNFEPNSVQNSTSENTFHVITWSDHTQDEVLNVKFMTDSCWVELTHKDSSVRAYPKESILRIE